MIRFIYADELSQSSCSCGNPCSCDRAEQFKTRLDWDGHCQRVRLGA